MLQSLVCVCVCGGGKSGIFYCDTTKNPTPPFLPLPPQAINNDGSLNTTYTSVVFTAKQNRTAARKDGAYVFLFLRHKTIEFPNF